jgi:hypothetical protein
MELTLCLCCKHKIHKTVLNLGLQPLANNFHHLHEADYMFPLHLLYCEVCFHMQLNYAVDPTVLFKTYKYVSGTSQTGLQFFRENAMKLTNYKRDCVTKNVLDIACNDGSQLNFFKEHQWNTYGVDPATNLAEISASHGHTIICDFWNASCASQLPLMDIIIAQNVFAHIVEVDDFLQCCKQVMHVNTSLYIQTSQKDMIINVEFDTIYHEHISFFNVNSMQILGNRNGLKLHSVDEHFIHGNSYIFEFKLSNDESMIDCGSVNKYLESEKEENRYNSFIFELFNIRSKEIVIDIASYIDNYKSNGYRCIGYGASAKGQTLMCYGNIILDYIIDENPLKCGLLSPKFNIPIVEINEFEKDPSDKYVIVLLAWNFAEEIIKKIKHISKPGVEIIIVKNYFPDIQTLIL